MSQFGALRIDPTATPSVNAELCVAVFAEVTSSQTSAGDVVCAQQSLSGIVVEYTAAGSYQPLAVDLTLGATAGSTDGADPDFLAPAMFNVLGADLTDDANYIGGVIAAYNVTGVKATTYPAGPVLALIGDTVTEADGAVVAVIDGDSGVTKATAAFKAMSNNSTLGSGFLYGLDLYGPAHDGFSAFAILNAMVRTPNQVVWMEGDGAPTSGASGTGDNFAGKGSMYTDYTNANLYINAGTITSPDWKLVTRAG